MYGLKRLGAPVLGLLATTAITSVAWAHTFTIGYENAGPGSVTFWFGSYHTAVPYNEGSLNLSGPGTSTTVPFNQLAYVQPAGLIDGVTNFYTDNGSPATLVGSDSAGLGPVESWQGATFSGLQPGTYTFTYVPIANPTQEWDPWDDAILSSMVVLSGSIIGGGSDNGIMATESAVSMTTAQVEGFRQITRANANARQAVAQSDNVTIMSKNGSSTSDVSVWARIGGGVVNADFGGDLDASYFIGQAGVEFAFSPNLAAGISIGGGTTSAETSTDSLDGDSFFVQPYVAFTQGALTVVGSLGYTYTSYDDSANVIDSGDRFTGSLEVAYDVPLADSTTMTPFGFLAGGVENLDGGGDDVSFFIGRAGVELSRTMELLNTGTMTVYGSVAAEYVSTDEPGLSAPGVLVNYDDDRLGARVEAGLDFTVAGTDTQFFAAVDGSGLFTDAPGVGGRVGLKIPF